MSYRLRPALLCVAAAVIAAPFPSRAQDGPAMGSKALYMSDVQFRTELSSDHKALSVQFDNFSVALTAGGVSPAIRVLPLMFPVADSEKGSALSVKVRGGSNCPASVSCVGILWVSGQAKVFSTTPAKDSSGYLAEIELRLPGAKAYQASVVLIADRETGRQDLAASISIDALDLAIAPAQN